MNAPNTEPNQSGDSPAQVVDKVKAIASERCHLACDRASEMVRKNPLPTVLGALAFGAAVGYLVFSSRGTPSIGDRLVRESRSARSRLAEAPGFLSSLFHDGAEAASRQASRASSFVHDLPAEEVLHSISSKLDRISKRLKFW